ncbi:hypothetical protein ACFO3D_16170 [Virgibacillus kekensis]|uniref:DUF4023 domain-containing protein n=1 Tax=Virgibacillus kekensis TaxID=202261 RepID=A0ABV9DQ74_9BACI
MSEEKKLSMKEIFQQQLERKKQAQANNNKNKNQMNGANHRMQSQQAKKTSSTRRKIGG